MFIVYELKEIIYGLWVLRIFFFINGNFNIKVFDFKNYKLYY